MKITKLTITNHQNGYAVLELLFYMSLFSVLSLVVISAMITMTKSFKETAIQAELVQSVTIMEKISREIRASYDINSISASNLVLNTTDDSGANKTIEFSLLDSDIRLLENGIFTGNLNTSKITTTDLSFVSIVTAEGKAVKIFFTVRSENDASGRAQDFYNTVVLRGGYQ